MIHAAPLRENAPHFKKTAPGGFSDSVFRVLALDPSTDVTGVVVLDFDRMGAHLVRAAVAVRGVNEAGYGVGQGRSARAVDTLSDRIQRIAHTRTCLESWLADCPHIGSLSACAYEFHTGRGGAPSEAISEATGAYMTIAPLPSLPHYRVNPMTAKAAWGGAALVRADAKIAVVRWARREFGLTLSDTDDAIADALAVAVAAFGQWRVAGLADSQGVLFGAGARKFSTISRKTAAVSDGTGVAKRKAVAA